MLSPTLLKALASGTIAVTVNRRLARTLRQQYDQWQLELGKRAWPAAEILPWDEWLNGWFQQLRADCSPLYRLLNREQSLCLWERVITVSGLTEPLINVTAIATQAQSAWAIQHAWHLHPVHAELSGDQRAYARWSDAYRRRCERNRWLDAGTLDAWLATRLQNSDTPAPKVVLILGFDTLSHAQNALLAALSERGAQVLIDNLPGGKTAEAVLQPCHDQADEILAAANWARSQLSQSETSRIGIVAPDLAACRTQLMQTLDQTFAPNEVPPLTSTVSRYYNISLGLPLNRYPLVGTALRYLAWICRVQPLEHCTDLLLSPYLGTLSEERWQRAQADVQLRRQGGAGFSLRALASALRRKPNCPVDFCARSEAALRAYDTLPRQQSCAAWSQSIDKLLTLIGWPGDAALSSEEYQVCSAWQQTLHRLAGFDAVDTDCTFSEALARLAQSARDTVFQAESNDAVRLHLVGLLESIGMQFDALWIMGMDDLHWPQRPRPNPLLPPAVQRAVGAPHNSAEWEAGFARRSLARLLGSADRVICSYPCNDGDAHIAASPLVALLPIRQSDAVQPDYRGPWRELQALSATLEKYPDQFAPARSAGAAVRGGAAVLSDQAECPFRAFARHRLGAEPLDEPYIGVNPIERGVLLHAAMEYFWQTLRSQEALLSLDGAALRRHIQAAVSHALSTTKKSVDKAFVELEHNHLSELIGAWLTCERGRAPFSIDALEQRHTLTIGGLSLDLRIDRSDRLDSGERLLIDYKTGAPRAQDWMTMRPRDVQLPLYALADPQPVAAVALAYVRPQQSAFAGVSADDTGLAGICACTDQSRRRDALPFDNWQALVAHWHRQLTELAEEFAGGVASVTPRSFPSTCEHCALGPLCRVRPDDTRLPIADE